MFEYEAMAALPSVAEESVEWAAWGAQSTPGGGVVRAVGGEPRRGLSSVAGGAGAVGAGGAGGAATAAGRRVAGWRDARESTVSSLRERMRELQPTLFPARALPTHPALSALLPGGALRAGGTYVVSGSYSFALAALAAATDVGQWVAVAGFPHVGVEAAAELGVDVDRLVIVPDVGADWLSVVVALIDAMSVVVLSAPRGVDEATAVRLSSRLRQRESALVVVGEWPRADARVVADRRHWQGLGRGWGSLAACEYGVVVDDHLGRSRRHECAFTAAGMAAVPAAAPPRLRLVGDAR